jgi:hypothetical protein
MPFACSYLPIENPKVVWPLTISSVFVVTYGLARVERLALQTPVYSTLFCGALVAMVLAVKVIDRARRRERLPVDFDERPALPTQRLGLFEL